MRLRTQLVVAAKKAAERAGPSGRKLQRKIASAAIVSSTMMPPASIKSLLRLSVSRQASVVSV